MHILGFGWFSYHHFVRTRCSSTAIQYKQGMKLQSIIRNAVSTISDHQSGSNLFYLPDPLLSVVVSNNLVATNGACDHTHTLHMCTPNHKKRNFDLPVKSKSWSTAQDTGRLFIHLLGYKHVPSDDWTLAVL